MSYSVRGQPAFTIEDIVRLLLEDTNTLGPPTSAERIARRVNLSIRGFFHEEYRLDPKIRAYLLPASKEIGIARSLSPHRKKFSILHEVGHYVIPGHLDNLPPKGIVTDDDRTLADHSVITREMEANRFAADCIFQLERFRSTVDALELSWANIKRMARSYDTSIIATARRWVEGSLIPCALVVFVPVSLREMVSLRLSYVIVSESFKHKYFARLSRFSLDADSEAALAFKTISGDADRIQTLAVEINGQDHEFEMMLFSTLYNVYGLIVS